MLTSHFFVFICLRCVKMNTDSSDTYEKLPHIETSVTIFALLEGNLFYLC